jgi:hypothetical protein
MTSWFRGTAITTVEKFESSIERIGFKGLNTLPSRKNRSETDESAAFVFNNVHQIDRTICGEILTEFSI